MDDLISKKAAIDALRGYLVGKRCPDDGTLTCRLIENEVINKLPTIHPEPGTNLAEVGTDCISREQAIEIIEDYPHGDWNVDTMSDMVGKIKQLPPIQPKRETATVSVGMSKGGVTMWYECEACGEPVDQGDTFCSGCGRELIHE